jgi:2-dehydropantoate 2-reductase
MQHAILGAGGVGGLVGAVLAREGETVTLIVRPDAAEHYPRELSLDSKTQGTFSVAVSVTSSLFQPVDVLWIAVKATDLQNALGSIQLTAKIGAVVPLLNGIDHIALLRDRFGRDKIVPATIAVETERIAPGQIVWRSPFARLNLSSTGRKLLATTVERLSALGFECHFVDDENTLMWSKLVFLAPFALSTAAASAPIGQITADPRGMIELQELVVEACAVAVKSGAKVDANAVVSLFKTAPPGMRSSMQKDVEEGKLPELDAIAGPILRGAETFGISVPATKRFVQQIEHKLERAPASKI